MVEQWNSHDRTLEQKFWNSKTSEKKLEQWKQWEKKTVEQRWWNSRTSHFGTVGHLIVKQWNRDCGIVEHLLVKQ